MHTTTIHKVYTFHIGYIQKCEVFIIGKYSKTFITS